MSENEFNFFHSNSSTHFKNCQIEVKKENEIYF